MALPYRTAALLSAALALTACTSGSSPKGSAPDGSAPSAGGKTVQKTFELAGYASRTAKVPDAPIASTPTAIAGLELQVYLLQRDQKGVLVVFALHNTGTGDLSDISGTSLGEGYSLDYTVGAVSLVDTAGLKQYLVLRPKDFADEATVQHPGPCACSRTSGGNLSTFGANEVHYFAAEIAAPPPEVTKLSFVTPLGTVADLQVSDG